MRCQWRQVSAQRLLRTRSTFSKSVMVSVAVPSLGFTDLILIEPGVKINGEYYRDVLLSPHLLPAIHNISGSECFAFQQDNAPAHRAGENSGILVSQYSWFHCTIVVAAKQPGLKPGWLSSLECALPEPDSQRGTVEKNWSKSGTISHTESLTMPSSNGVFDWGHVFVKTVATLRTNCPPNCESNRCCEWRPYWKP